MINWGSMVIKAEVWANPEEFREATAYFVKENYTINIPLLNTAPSISGVFINKEDSFDPKRHQINIKRKYVAPSMEPNVPATGDYAYNVV